MRSTVHGAGPEAGREADRQAGRGTVRLRSGGAAESVPTSTGRFPGR